MNVTEKRKSRELFRKRIAISVIMIFAWSMSGPVIKEYYKLFSAEFFSLVGIWVLFIGLGQAYLRKKYSGQDLLKMTVILDIIYVLGITVSGSIGGIHHMLFFELVYDGPYDVVLFAAFGNLEKETFSGWKSKPNIRITAGIDNKKRVATIMGLTVGGLLSQVFDIYQIMAIKLIFISIGVVLTIKALRD